MILVKMTVYKRFDIVDDKDALVYKIINVLSQKLVDEYNELIDYYRSQGKIKKRFKEFKKNDVDNWTYESMIYYDDIETHKKCFDTAHFQTILEKLKKGGFEIRIDVKNVSKLLTNAI